MDMEREEGVVVIGRAQIDTRAPFRSVKEAVMLFGERVLVGEVYAHKINKMKAASSSLSSHDTSHAIPIAIDLEETRKNLDKARKESLAMASCLASLEEELEKTKMELNMFKSREIEKRVIESTNEELKYVENTTDANIETSRINETKFQNKRYVKFANPPCLAQVINEEEKILKRQFSMDKNKTTLKTKKKNLFNRFLGTILLKTKKASQDCGPPKAYSS